MAKVLPSDLSDSQSLDGLVALCPRLEIKSISAGELGRKQFRLYSRINFSFCCHPCSCISLHSLSHDDIENIIFEAGFPISIS
jgi:hypothetical protein